MSLTDYPLAYIIAAVTHPVWLSCISFQPSNYSIYMKDHSDNHMINLASDKCFGMVGTCQEEMVGNCTADRIGEYK